MWSSFKGLPAPFLSFFLLFNLSQHNHQGKKGMRADGKGPKEGTSLAFCVKGLTPVRKREEKEGVAE